MNRYAIALLLASIAPSAFSQTVGFDLSGGSSFTVGQVFDLTLEASALPNGLTGGGIDLQFNSAVLNLQSVAVNSAFDYQSSGTIDNVGGTAAGVDFFAALNPALTGSTIPIATFQFVAEGSGSSGLSLSLDSIFGPFIDGGLNPINAGTDFIFATSTVSVAPVVSSVPEIDSTFAASALFLLLGGLAVLRGRRSI